MTRASDGEIQAALTAAWERSDRIFDLLRPQAWLERPIPLRHPFLFYLGHLPAFAWRQIGRGVLGRPSFRPEFDDLFERGIDPASSAEIAGGDSGRWPDREEILAYRDRVRARVLDDGLEAMADGRDAERAAAARQTLHVTIEHELMHHETLLYMIQELDPSLKESAQVLRAPAPAGDAGSPEPSPSVEREAEERVSIPRGRVRLGAEPTEIAFGWDNEHPAHEVDVAAFSIEVRPVTNARFRAFVEGGGYDDAEAWTPADRAWLAARPHPRPHAWVADERGRLHVRAIDGPVPFDEAEHWPVQVTQAEAQAFARWRGGRLPTEAELQRAAFGSPGGEERAHARGDDPAVIQGAVDFAVVTPQPVGRRRAGVSAFGVEELIGNGWEWSSSPFRQFPGFRPTIPTYPGYSADFFDDEHVVVFGGSWATDRRLLRPSFRNWYRRHYPYPFTKFRLVHEALGR